MSIDTAAAAYVASIPAQRAEPEVVRETAQDDGTIVIGRWQAAVAMLAGLAAGALIVAGVVLPW
jgi:hypothetical protein